MRPTLKIDTHQHFWQYSAIKHAWINDEMQILKQDYLPEYFKHEMYRADYQYCVAVQADQSEAETAFLLALASEHDFIKGVVGWVDFRAENIAERLEYFAQFPLLKGFRHVVQDEVDDYFLLQPDFLRGIARLADFNFTYDILIYPKHLKVAAEFVSQFPQQKFVLDHIAKPLIKDQVLSPWKEDIQALAQFPNVFCKLSGMVTEAYPYPWNPKDFKPYLDTILEAFGTDRLMIGSDYPVCKLAGAYCEVMNLVETYIAFLSVEEQQNILGWNAKAFYGL
jgi:L-fuconolactonase